ncbi:MAG: hypothetical protein AAGN35_15145 [Bacteroidota bacterium]
MDPITLNFTNPPSPEIIAQITSAPTDLEVYLAEQLIAEMDRGIAENPTHDGTFRQRRAAAQHVHWKVVAWEEAGLQLVGAPRARLAGAFDHSSDLLPIWLGDATRRYLQEKHQFTTHTVYVPAPESFPTAPPPVSPVYIPSSSGGIDWINIVFGLALLFIIGTIGFSIFRTYRMIDEVKTSYTEIKETVDHHTEEILDQFERTLVTSDRVVNMMDQVKGLILPEDSTQ